MGQFQTPPAALNQEQTHDAVAKAIEIARGSYDAEKYWLHETIPGYGYHTHDEECETRPERGMYRCMQDCDDSDLIITIAYRARGGGAVWHATYGLKDGEVTLWAD